MIEKLHALAVSAMMLVSSWFGATPTTVVNNEPVQQPAPSLGTALPTATAVFETSLASPITATADTMTLSANSVRGGGSLSGFTCFTLDEGSAQAEYVCGMASSTSVTSLSRGISPADGITEVTALKFAHRRGTNVKITDFPLIQRLKAQNNGEGTFENVISYASGVTPSGLDQIADVGYVLSAISGTSSIATDRLIVAGIAGETISVGQVVYFDTTVGKWLKASAATTASSTSVLLGTAQGAGTSGSAIANGVLVLGYDQTQGGGSAGQTLFLSNTAGATSTTAGTVSVVLGQVRSAGIFYFDAKYRNFANLGTSNTFTATNTFSGVVSFATSTTVSGITLASSTVFTFDASGTFTKPTNVGTMAYVEVWGPGGSGASQSDHGASGGGGGGYAWRMYRLADLPATTSVTVGTGGAAVSGGSDGNGGSASSTFGTLFGAFQGGGGARCPNDTNDFNASGGAGAGPLGAGAAGASNGAAAAGSPGSPLAGGGVSGDVGGSGLYGAAGGGCTGVNGSSVGGNAFFGGAGGGGAGTSGSAGGTSVFGGNGGAGSTTTATAGSVPGGGGGASRGGTSGAGGSGRVKVTVF